MSRSKRTFAKSLSSPDEVLQQRLLPRCWLAQETLLESAFIPTFKFINCRGGGCQEPFWSAEGIVNYDSFQSIDKNQTLFLSINFGYNFKQKQPLPFSEFISSQELTRALRINLQCVSSQGVIGLGIIRLELYNLSTFGFLSHTQFMYKVKPDPVQFLN